MEAAIEAAEARRAHAEAELLRLPRCTRTGAGRPRRRPRSMRPSRGGGSPLRTLGPSSPRSGDHPATGCSQATPRERGHSPGRCWIRSAVGRIRPHAARLTPRRQHMAQNERQGMEAAGRRGAGEAGPENSQHRGLDTDPAATGDAGDGQVVRGAGTGRERVGGSSEGRLPRREKLGRLHRILRREPVRPLPPPERGHGPALLRKRRARARDVRGFGARSCLTSTSTNARASSSSTPTCRESAPRTSASRSRIRPWCWRASAESSRTRPAAGCVASRGPTAPSGRVIPLPPGRERRGGGGALRERGAGDHHPFSSKRGPGDWRSSPAAPEAPPPAPPATRRGTDSIPRGRRTCSTVRAGR